jgi:hypothetical protein
MDPLEIAIAEAAMATIKAIVNQVEESRMADAQKKQAILARLQTSQSALDAARTEEETEFNNLKNKNS